MKHYPSIPSKDLEIPKEKVYIFDKIDGSQIRAEYILSKKDFFKFGSKKVLIDSNTPILNESINLIKKESNKFYELCKQNKWDKITCFFEFYGKESFAGSHKNEPHEVSLFDICVYKKGFILPKDFLDKTKNIDIKIQKLLAYEHLDKDFIQDVKNGKIDGMSFEGVVCKGKYITPGMPWMIKIKTFAWINKVKEKYGNDINVLTELL